MWIPQTWRAHPHEYATPIDPISMEITNQYRVKPINAYVSNEDLACELVEAERSHGLLYGTQDPEHPVV